MERYIISNPTYFLNNNNVLTQLNGNAANTAAGRVPDVSGCLPGKGMEVPEAD